MLSGTDDLDNRFAYHRPPTEEVGNKHEAIRALCLDLAKSIETIVPNGREKALAITKLEETMMWANAGIARHNWDYNKG